MVGKPQTHRCSVYWTHARLVGSGCLHEDVEGGGGAVVGLGRGQQKGHAGCGHIFLANDHYIE